MEILGWLALFAIASYLSFAFIVGNMFSSAFSGRGMDVASNVLLIAGMCSFWYLVYIGFPFSISMR